MQYTLIWEKKDSNGKKIRKKENGIDEKTLYNNMWIMKYLKEQIQTTKEINI